MLDSKEQELVLKEERKQLDIKSNIGEYLQRFGIFIALFIMCAYLSIASPHFLTGSNLANVLLQSSINAILALGVTFVIISGGIDLSLGSVLALSGVVMGVILKNLKHTDYYIAALLIGVLCGFTNGIFITRLNLPPFIATLGMMSISRGLALVITQGYPISGLPEPIRFIGGGKILGISTPVVIVAVMFIISHIILTQTKLGRYDYAIGGNEEAAKLSGVNVKKYKVILYSIAGFFSGVAGIVLAARVNSALAIAGMGYELDAIAAAVIGGVSQAGGEGTVAGTILGAIVMGVLRNGLNLLDVSTYWQQVVIGIVLVGAVSLDQLKRR